MLFAPSTGALNIAFICWHFTMALLASVSDADQDSALSSCHNLLLGQTTLFFICSHSKYHDGRCEPFLSLGRNVTRLSKQAVVLSPLQVPLLILR